MKIIFFGSDDFAVTNLEALIQSEHEVVACVTQPDRAKGRGLKIEPSVIKQCAQKQGITVFQPENLKDDRFIRQLKNYNCDLFVVIAYGKILPPELLQIPYVCAMNVHASLLPKYRGAAPINWVIINGEKETGVSIIKMNAQMDAGDIFAQAKIKIEEQDTAITLKAKLAQISAKLLISTINSLEKNAYTLTVQDNHAMTYAPKLTKEMGLIDWSKKAIEIHNLVRGLLPWPTAYTFFKRKLLKILETQVTPLDLKSYQPGEVIQIVKSGFIVVTGDQALLIKKVHLEASRLMEANHFVLGHSIKRGFSFSIH